MKKFVTWFIIIGATLGILLYLAGIIYAIIQSVPASTYVQSVVSLIIFGASLWLGLWYKKTENPNKNWFLVLFFVLQLFAIHSPDFEYMFVVGIGHYQFWDASTLRYSSSLTTTPKFLVRDNALNENTFGINFIALIFLVWLFVRLLWPKRKPAKKNGNKLVVS